MKRIKLFNAYGVDLERMCYLRDEIIEFLAGSEKLRYNEIHIPKCFCTDDDILNLIAYTNVHERVKLYGCSYTSYDIVNAIDEHIKTKRKFILVAETKIPEHICSIHTVVSAIENGSLDASHLKILVPVAMSKDLLVCAPSLISSVIFVYRCPAFAMPQLPYPDLIKIKSYAIPDIVYPHGHDYRDVDKTELEARANILSDYINNDEGLRKTIDDFAESLAPLPVPKIDGLFTPNPDTSFVTTKEVHPALKHIKPYTPSKLGDAHNKLIHDKLMNATQAVFTRYNRPKLEISEVTEHGDGSISVKIGIDEEAIKRDRGNVFLNIIRAVNRTLAEQEEEIINGE